MLSSISAATGHLLISEPFMMDPNFKRSVIILTEYSDRGTVGLVLNHQSDFLLGDYLPDTPYSALPVFTGGPVGNNTLHFIHQRPDLIPDGLEITDGVYWGGNFETVKALISNHQLVQREIKFFTGYSGWTAGQLETELRENSWIVTDKFTPDMLFNDDEHLWRDVVISLGTRYAHIANFPENPSLN